MSSPANILVIDDDFGMRELLVLHLIRAGYQVRGAEDAVEGGRMLMEQRPDLVLLDVRMPHLGGDEFLKLLRGDEGYADLKVIMLTSISNDGMYAKITNLGVCAFLAKPVDKDVLLDAVRKALAEPATPG
jgi:two-component system chemotaxis response regulator CheY